ncbi:hypothetical protein LMG27952_04100 [Paraburkholderia hiiakae]|uniref:Uncharacterized protein n=1 Tax=Paraburkholderia hiiakae TaxID=1081782 RepID=A0ABN7I167_9BURK|nr:hypothetical protein [Paraburkholderia hiiakae]CAD6543863.1 hypothetical protein LMG27952_04100 [Paraburkholderia hiiakae]
MPVAGMTLAAAFAVALVILYRRERSVCKAQRMRLFDGCFALFERAVLTQDDVAWPVLTGCWRNHHVRIEPVVDGVVFRQVPSLWLVVSVRQDLPIAGTFDLLARRRNVEFYSPAADLPWCVQLPGGWPDHTTLKSDRKAFELPLGALDPHVRALFADPRAKELVVMPGGVRIVYQVQGADRSEYLVLRSATFRGAHVSVALLESLLERATAVCADLMRGSDHANA